MSDERIQTEITGSVTGLVAAMAEAKETVAVGTEAIAGSFEAMALAVEAAIAPLLVIAALLEGGRIFKEAVASAAELGKELEILSQKTGIGAEELSALRYAADLSDVSVEQLSTGLKFLSRNMESGAAGFKALGVSVRDAQGHLLPVNDVLAAVATRFATMEDGAGKTALAMNLFGRSGADLIPLLNQGAAGIEALEVQAKKLGVTMSEEDVVAANKYVDQMKEFHSVMDALGRDLGIVIIPILTKLAEWAEKGAEAMIRLLEKIRLLKPDLTSALDNDPALVAALGIGKTKPAPDLPHRDRDAEEFDRIQRELNVNFEKAVLKQIADSLEAEQRWEEQQTKIWMDAFAEFPKAWDSALKDWKQGGESMLDFWRDLMRDLVKEAAIAEAKMLESHAAMCLAKKGITVAGVTEEVAAATWSTLLIVAQYAIQAGAAAWAAISAIPIVGPFLAPAVAAATIAGVLALASGGFGGGGGGGGGSSGSANRSASSSSGGSGSAQHVTNIYAWDSQSLHDFAMRNSETFAKAAIAGGVSKGVKLPTSPGRG